MGALHLATLLAVGGGEELAPAGGPPSLRFLFPLGFVSVWVFYCLWLAHWGGWSRLAVRYRCDRRPEGVIIRTASAGMGWVNYHGFLTLVVAREGLYMSVWPLFRLAHPPILIPWEEMGAPVEKRFLFWRYAELPVGSPPIVRLRLSPKVLEARLAVEEEAETPSGALAGQKDLRP